VLVRSESIACLVYVIKLDYLLLNIILLKLKEPTLSSRFAELTFMLYDLQRAKIAYLFFLIILHTFEIISSFIVGTGAEFSRVLYG
jgi:hypothetical protein